jgi:hypothetical protein
MLHVIDAPAINYVGRKIEAPAIFDALHDHIQEEKLCFPDEVLEELKRLAKGEFTYSWVKAAAVSRFNKGAAYKHYVAVTSQVTELIDIYAEHESSCAAVLAQAYSLILAGHPVTVITEDVRDKPTRISLAAACERMHMTWCRLDQYLHICGYGDLC